MARLRMLPPLLSTATPKRSERNNWHDTRSTSSTERGYGWAWQQAVKRIRARDHDVCQPCLRRNDGRIGTYGAVDHKVPKFEGGTDDEANLEVICDDCHAPKTAAESLRARGLA